VAGLPSVLRQGKEPSEKVSFRLSKLQTLLVSRAE
jgi:hypothetical protein